jgi:hypothetical protein
MNSGNMVRRKRSQARAIRNHLSSVNAAAPRAMTTSTSSVGIQSVANTHHQDQSVTWASLRAMKSGSASVATIRGGKPLS